VKWQKISQSEHDAKIRADERIKSRKELLNDQQAFIDNAGIIGLKGGGNKWHLN
jgi:hypothetical protein